MNFIFCLQGNTQQEDVCSVLQDEVYFLCLKIDDLIGFKCCSKTYELYYLQSGKKDCLIFYICIALPSSKIINGFDFFWYFNFAMYLKI